MYFRSDDGYQNIFVYQATFNLLEFKIDKGAEYVIGWKSKGVHNSELIALRGAFSRNMKYSKKEYNLIEQKQLQNENCKCLHRI